MAYHGFEVFFLYLGNADSILVRHYDQGEKTLVLIDGGYKRHAPFVRSLLRDLGESEIHHLICSHHHEDHAAGLIELVGDTSLTIRKAWVHVGDLMADRVDRSRFSAFSSLLRRLQESKTAQNALVQALNRRSIPIQEPFAPESIGPLLLVSPTRNFYNAQMELGRQEAVLTELNQRYSARDMRTLMESIRIVTSSESDAEDDNALGGEPTSPENEVSTVLWLPWRDAANTANYFLLTADAGTAALSDIRARSKASSDELKGVKWMQLPHHGSRRNMNESLLDYFRPHVGFVSAVGTKKHPSVKLVNAVKARNGLVFSTHYPPEKTEGAWLRQFSGDVPALNVTPATPLWDK